MNGIFKYSDDNECPVTILSGDVHSASFFQLEKFDDFPKAKVFNATSSAISRKPAPGKAEWLMKKSGKISRYPGATVTRLYARAGDYNFLTVTAEVNADKKASVRINLHLPAGDENEILSKKISLI